MRTILIPIVAALYFLLPLPQPARPHAAQEMDPTLGNGRRKYALCPPLNSLILTQS